MERGFSLTRVETASVIAAVVLVAAVRGTVGDTVLLGVLSGALVGAAVVAGPSVALAGGFGVVVADVSAAAVGVWTVVDAVGVAVVPLFVSALWGRVGIVPRGVTPRMTSAREGAEYLVVAALAAVVGLATVAWVVAAGGYQPFLTGHVAFLARTAGAASVGSFAVSVLGRLSPEEVPFDGLYGGRIGTRRIAAATLLGIGWYLVGTGLGALTADLQVSARSATGVMVDARASFGADALGSTVGRLLALLWTVGDAAVLGLGLVAMPALWYALTPSHAGVARRSREESNSSVSTEGDLND